MKTKTLTTALFIGFAAAFTLEVNAEMKPDEAVNLIQKTFSDTLQQSKNPENLKETLLDTAEKAGGKSELTKYIKLYRKVAGYIEKLELAASLTNDLIQLGLHTNEKKFATEFARRFKVYLAAYTSPREMDNLLLDHRFNDDDLQTVLFDLGRNVFRSLDKQTNKPKLQEAGRAIQNMSPAELGRYVKAPKALQKQLDEMTYGDKVNKKK